MTTEDIIEELIQQGVKAYKKLNGNTQEGKMLTKHKPIQIEGIEFSCWREYSVYKTAEYLRDLLPEIPIEVELDGNNTVLKIEVSVKEQQKINSILYSFLTENNFI